MVSLSAVAAVLATAILSAVAAIHLYWAAGGSFGKAAAIPTRDGEPVLHPSALGTVLVAAALLATAGLVAGSRGWVDLPGGLQAVAPLAAAAAALVFALRAIGDFRYVGFFKRIRNSRFARYDTRFYSPLCVVLAMLIGLAIL